MRSCLGTAAAALFLVLGGCGSETLLAGPEDDADVTSDVDARPEADADTGVHVDAGEDVGDDGVDVCLPVAELCDRADNDCDSETDEDSDLGSDPANCSTCGAACRGAPNATATCRDGTCGLDCVAGYVDANGSPIDGCEYFCTPTGAESPEDGTCLDGLDNDCDGRSDWAESRAPDPAGAADDAAAPPAGALGALHVAHLAAASPRSASLLLRNSAETREARDAESCTRSGALGAPCKAAHPLREEGGSPCEKSSTRGAPPAAQKEPRGPRRSPGGAGTRAATRVNPHVAPSHNWGGRTPPGRVKAALVVKQDDTCNDELPRGIRGGTRTRGCVEHGRPRGERVATATGGSRRQPRPFRRCEESDGVMSDEGAVAVLEQETPAVRHATGSGEGQVIA